MIISEKNLIDSELCYGFTNSDKFKIKNIFQETIRYLLFTPWKKSNFWVLLGGIALILATAPITLAENTPTNFMVLTENQINEKIQKLPDWKTDGKEITRTFQFSDFIAAIDFVNKLVEPAETAGHHPDIAISYNKVTISLTTHDAGGITDKDFALAETISQLAK